MHSDTAKNSGRGGVGKNTGIKDEPPVDEIRHRLLNVEVKKDGVASKCEGYGPITGPADECICISSGSENESGSTAGGKNLRKKMKELNNKIGKTARNDEFEVICLKDSDYENEEDADYIYDLKAALEELDSFDDENVNTKLGIKTGGEMRRLDLNKINDFKTQKKFVRDRCHQNWLTKNSKKINNSFNVDVYKDFECLSDRRGADNIEDLLPTSEPNRYLVSSDASSKSVTNELSRKISKKELVHEKSSEIGKSGIKRNINNFYSKKIKNKVDEGDKGISKKKNNDQIINNGLIFSMRHVVDPASNGVEFGDLYGLFLTFNEAFFNGVLNHVEVKWSRRMTLCAGLCVYMRGGFCSIRLSEPILKYRSFEEMEETLLHEMIHAYLFVSKENSSHSAHGSDFLAHMKRINGLTGLSITVYHNFTAEIELYRRHVWKCQGPCKDRPPYFGVVRRAMNREPGPLDFWWDTHKTTCGGNFVKIEEPPPKQKKISEGRSTESGLRNVQVSLREICSKVSADKITWDELLKLILAFLVYVHSPDVGNRVKATFWKNRKS